MEPTPSTARISYGPSRCPGASVIIPPILPLSADRSAPAKRLFDPAPAAPPPGWSSLPPGPPNTNQRPARLSFGNAVVPDLLDQGRARDAEHARELALVARDLAQAGLDKFLFQRAHGSRQIALQPAMDERRQRRR